MKKILLLGCMVCLVTACQTMDSVKSGFSDSFASARNLFSSSPKDAPCPSFVVSEELDNYYDIPGAAEQAQNSGLTSAAIENISGACRMNENADIVTVSLDIDFTANAGGDSAESVENKTIEIPYFIAVLNADQDILAKDTFTIPLEISGAAKKTYHKERLQQNISVLKTNDPSTYTIITGFQLNEPQLAYAKEAENIPEAVTAIEPAAGEDINPDTIEGADPFAGR